EFVATETGQRDLEAEFMRRLAHKPDVDAINRRLIHGLDDTRQVGSKLVLTDDTRRVPSRIEIRDRRGLRPLVIWRATEFIEHHRHLLYISLPGSAHKTADCAGIPPCR